MQKFEEPVQNLRGDTIVLAPMLVLLAGTETPASIFSDAAGETPILAPRSDKTGVFGFYAPNGRYDVYAILNGARTGHKLDLLLYDPADAGGGAVSSQAFAALSGAVQSLADAAETTSEALDAANVQINALRTAVANVTTFAVAGESDHTAMFNRASAAARRVYVPSGSYTIASANWPADTEFYGDGDTSIIHMPASAQFAFVVDSGSASVASNVKNLRMHSLQLRGTCDVDGFSEFKHLVSLNGVTNVLIEHVLFKGFRGDGLYIGSGTIGGQERHNQNVTARHNRFDGINHENRNAISIIDCDGGSVAENVFVNCTKSTMPGPIDMEPDAYSFHILRNIRIGPRNYFKNNGGNVGEIGVYVPSAVAVVPQNITVEGNISDDYLGSGYFFHYNDNRAPTATSPDSNIKLLNNSARNGNNALGLLSGKRITVEGNDFSDMKADIRIGYVDAITKVRDLTMGNNRLTRIGSVSGTGMSIFNVDGMHSHRDKFIDCGSGTAGAANAIDFNNGASSYVVFDSLEVSSPTGKTQVAIQKEASHTLATSTNRFVGGVVNGMYNGFTYA